MALQGLVMGDAGTAVGNHRESMTVTRIAPDRGVDRSVGRVGVALDQGHVEVLSTSRFLKSRLSAEYARMGSRDHHDATGPYVQSVYHAVPFSEPTSAIW